MNTHSHRFQPKALLLAGAAALIFHGCATITEGSSQTILIETDPVGAMCELTRDGQVITRLHDTPATISVHKESGDLQLSCSKTGYLDSTLSTASDFQDMVLGNILIGGLIGVAIDMGSGATSKYPNSISITLVPETFESETSRESYFNEIRQRLEEKADIHIAKIREDCENGGCQQQVDQIVASRDKQLSHLAGQKARTQILP